MPIEWLFICFDLLKGVCPEVIHACPRCALSCYENEFIRQGHDETGCAIGIALFREDREDLDAADIESTASLIVDEWMSRGRDWRIFPAILMVLSDFVSIVEIREDQTNVLFDGPCISCLFDIDTDASAAGHDERLCQQAIIDQECVDCDDENE